MGTALDLELREHGSQVILAHADFEMQLARNHLVAQAVDPTLQHLFLACRQRIAVDALGQALGDGRTQANASPDSLADDACELVQRATLRDLAADTQLGTSTTRRQCERHCIE